MLSAELSHIIVTEGCCKRGWVWLKGRDAAWAETMPPPPLAFFVAGGERRHIVDEARTGIPFVSYSCHCLPRGGEKGVVFHFFWASHFWKPVSHSPTVSKGPRKETFLRLIGTKSLKGPIPISLLLLVVILPTLTDEVFFVCVFLHARLLIPSQFQCFKTDSLRFRKKVRPYKSNKVHCKMGWDVVQGSLWTASLRDPQNVFSVFGGPRRDWTTLRVHSAAFLMIFACVCFFCILHEENTGFFFVFKLRDQKYIYCCVGCEWVCVRLGKISICSFSGSFSPMKVQRLNCADIWSRFIHLSETPPIMVTPVCMENTYKGDTGKVNEFPAQNGFFITHNSLEKRRVFNFAPAILFWKVLFIWDIKMLWLRVMCRGMCKGVDVGRFWIIKIQLIKEGSARIQLGG